MRMTVWGLCAALIVSLVSCGRSGREVYLNEESPEAEFEEEENVEETAENEDAEAGPANEADDAGADIYVHVCGQVVNPGVYKLKAGARGFEAVELAGGLSSEAAQESINLAEMLEDGQQLFIPSLEQARELQEQAARAASGLVNINEAGEKELMELPGIGEARAGMILRYRKSRGDFGSIEELKQVDGISESVFEKLKDLITIE